MGTGGRCKTSRKCVSIVWHSRCLFLSHDLKKNGTETHKSSKCHNNKHLSICTSASSCFSCTFLPNITPLFSIPSNLASDRHHRDLELAPTVARQQWQEAFSFNYGSCFVLHLVRAMTYSNSCTDFYYYKNLCFLQTPWLFSSVYFLSSSMFSIEFCFWQQLFHRP